VHKVIDRPVASLILNHRSARVDGSRADRFGENTSAIISGLSKWQGIGMLMAGIGRLQEAEMRKLTVILA
jgi:hypothetical protein